MNQSPKRRLRSQFGRTGRTPANNQNAPGAEPAQLVRVDAGAIQELLDPAVWQAALEQYALVTDIAVQLLDIGTEPVGECLNPQPLWRLFQENRASTDGCRFCTISPNDCSGLTDALQQRDVVFTRDRIGLVHFSVPLFLGEQPIGWVLAGQVFDRYPESLSVERAAREVDLMPEKVWAVARQAHPIPRSILSVYADLLATLVSSILQARYGAILEARRVDQLRQAQKLESIGILAGGVAHDFNNLLTGIIGSASLILNDLPPHHPARIRVEEICAASERAAGLTRQLLAYSGQGRFIVEPLDLSNLVRDMKDLLRLSVPKGISLNFELAGRLPAIEADASQMQQIVMNLVINGSEAIAPSQGAIVVRTGARDLDAEYIRHTLAPGIQPGPYVFLEVQDNGSGMGEATLARVFEPFFTTKFTGRGLGLAAVSGIVRGHRGTIKVDTATGEGTTFKVLFPASEKAAERAAPAAESTTKQGSGTILVVDNEEVVRSVARAALERSGYSVLLAENGTQGIELFRGAAGKISLVLLDMTMPGLSGHDTFLGLRQIRPDIKVVLSSGYDEQEARQRFAGEGLAGFIQKPYTFAALNEKVSAVFQCGR